MATGDSGKHFDDDEKETQSDDELARQGAHNTGWKKDLFKFHTDDTVYSLSDSDVPRKSSGEDVDKARKRKRAKAEKAASPPKPVERPPIQIKKPDVPMSPSTGAIKKNPAMYQKPKKPKKPKKLKRKVEQIKEVDETPKEVETKELETKDINPKQVDPIQKLTAEDIFKKLQHFDASKDDSSDISTDVDNPVELVMVDPKQEAREMEKILEEIEDEEERRKIEEEINEFDFDNTTPVISDDSAEAERPVEKRHKEEIEKYKVKSHLQEQYEDLNYPGNTSPVASTSAQTPPEDQQKRRIRVIISSKEEREARRLLRQQSTDIQYRGLPRPNSPVAGCSRDLDTPYDEERKRIEKMSFIIEQQEQRRLLQTQRRAIGHSDSSSPPVVGYTKKIAEADPEEKRRLELKLNAIEDLQEKRRVEEQYKDLDYPGPSTIRPAMPVCIAGPSKQLKEGDPEEIRRIELMFFAMEEEQARIRLQRQLEADFPESALPGASLELHKTDSEEIRHIELMFQALEQQEILTSRHQLPGGSQRPGGSSPILISSPRKAESTDSEENRRIEQRLQEMEQYEDSYHSETTESTTAGSPQFETWDSEERQPGDDIVSKIESDLEKIENEQELEKGEEEVEDSDSSQCSSPVPGYVRRLYKLTGDEKKRIKGMLQQIMAGQLRAKKQVTYYPASASPVAGCSHQFEGVPPPTPTQVMAQLLKRRLVTYDDSDTSGSSSSAPVSVQQEKSDTEEKQPIEKMSTVSEHEEEEPHPDKDLQQLKDTDNSFAEEVLTELKITRPDENIQTEQEELKKCAKEKHCLEEELISPDIIASALVEVNEAQNREDTCFLYQLSDELIDENRKDEDDEYDEEYSEEEEEDYEDKVSLEPCSEYEDEDDKHHDKDENRQGDDEQRQDEHKQRQDDHEQRQDDHEQRQDDHEQRQDQHEQHQDEHDKSQDQDEKDQVEDDEYDIEMAGERPRSRDLLNDSERYERELLGEELYRCVTGDEQFYEFTYTEDDYLPNESENYSLEELLNALSDNKENESFDSSDMDVEMIEELQISPLDENTSLVIADDIITEIVNDVNIIIEEKYVKQLEQAKPEMIEALPPSHEIPALMEAETEDTMNLDDLLQEIEFYEDKQIVEKAFIKMEYDGKIQAIVDELQKIKVEDQEFNELEDIIKTPRLDDLLNDIEYMKGKRYLEEMINNLDFGDNKPHLLLEENTKDEENETQELNQNIGPIGLFKSHMPIIKVVDNYSNEFKKEWNLSMKKVNIMLKQQVTNAHMGADYNKGVKTEKHELRHVLELYITNMNIPTMDLLKEIKKILNRPMDIKWCDDKHGLLVLDSAYSAEELLKYTFEDIKLRPLTTSGLSAALAGSTFDLSPVKTENNPMDM